MLSGTKNKPIVGLDIEAGSVAATEVRVNGHAQLAGYGVVPLDTGVVREGEVADPGALGEALKQLFSEHKLSKSVRLGVANQRVAVRTLRLPPIEDPSELETAVRFQAQEELPMPLEQSVLEWQTIGASVAEDGTPRLDVVAVAARRDMVGKLLDAVRRAGLRPVGVDLSAFAMVRALHHSTADTVGATSYVAAPTETASTETVPAYEERIGGPQDPASADPMHAADTGMAKLYCSLGDVTNLAVARGSTCVFTRVSPFGVEGIAQKLAERRALRLEHARQWLVHTGLEQPVDQIEGEPDVISAAREALAEGSARLADEMRLSLDYYAAQEGALPVEGIIACGPGARIPGLADRLQRDLGYPFEVGRPDALGHLSDMDGARLTLPYGLALEE